MKSTIIYPSEKEMETDLKQIIQTTLSFHKLSEEDEKVIKAAEGFRAGYMYTIGKIKELNEL